MPVLSRAREIDWVLAAGAFDVVHVQVPYSPFLAARVIRRVNSATAVVGTFHVNSERPVVRFGARLLSIATGPSLRRFDRMMCVSSVARTFAHRWFGVQRAAIVPNMVDGSALRSMAAMRAPPGDRAPSLAFVGNLVPRKGVETLIAAMPAICNAHPAASLTIAGDGPRRARLEDRVRRARMTHAVRFVGSVSEREKAELLGDADIACFPSHSGESFGIVLLEAIAAGAGVVVGARNDAYEEVLRATPEALTAPRDPHDLARTLLRLLANPELRADVQARQQHLAVRHDIETITDQVVAVYRDALRSRGGSEADEGLRTQEGVSVAH
jgi:phosphatidylinositol alpha-mannosyltransferase